MLSSAVPFTVSCHSVRTRQFTSRTCLLFLFLRLAAVPGRMHAMHVRRVPCRQSPVQGHVAVHACTPPPCLTFFDKYYLYYCSNTVDPPHNHTQYLRMHSLTYRPPAPRMPSAKRPSNIFFAPTDHSLERRRRVRARLLPLPNHALQPLENPPRSPRQRRGQSLKATLLVARLLRGEALKLCQSRLIKGTLSS